MADRDPLLVPAATQQRRWILRAAEQVRRLDLAVYVTIGATPTPDLDGPLSRLSHAADYSRLSLSSAVVLALTGGERGRRASLAGVTAILVTSALMNLGVKPLVRRRRPDRTGSEIPLARQVAMPSSDSFPSGHAAAAFAFATAVGQVLPAAGFPLRVLAALVAYSRVHTGVHYPTDVLAGALMGGAIAQATVRALERRW